jgi:hypothetical protein
MYFWNNHRKAVDFDGTVENPGLKKAFEKIRLYNTPYYYLKVIAEIEVANFLLLVLDEGRTVVSENDVNFITVTNTSGQVYFPLFTDDDDAQLNKPADADVAAFVVDAVTAFKMTLEEDNIEGVVINPGSDQWIMNKESLNWFLGARK